MAALLLHPLGGLWACASYTFSFKTLHLHDLVKDVGGAVAVAYKMTSFTSQMTGYRVLMLQACIECK
jgi:hypothetical protein